MKKYIIILMGSLFASSAFAADINKSPLVFLNNSSVTVCPYVISSGSSPVLLRPLAPGKTRYFDATSPYVVKATALQSGESSCYPTSFIQAPLDCAHSPNIATVSARPDGTLQLACQTR